MSESRHAPPVRSEMSHEGVFLRPRLGRTPLGRRLQSALGEAGVDASPTAPTRQGRNSVRSSGKGPEGLRKETEKGPEIEAFVAAWGIAPEFFQSWFQHSFLKASSRPEGLRTIRVLASHLESGTFSVMRPVDGGIEIEVPALMRRSEAGSSDQQFDRLLRAQYRAVSALLFQGDVPALLEASLQRSKMLLADVIEEAFSTPAAEMESLFKEQVIARLLTRLRISSVQQREQTTQVVSQFFAALERAPHRFSLSGTALERQTGVEHMRHLVRIASIKNILQTAGLEAGLEERLLASFERLPQEWSLQERISTLPEQLQGSMQDRALVAVTQQHAEDGLRAVKEEVYRTIRPTDVTLASTLLHGTARRAEQHALIRSEQDTHDVIDSWDQIRQSLRILRRGLRAHEVGTLEQDIFVHEERRLEEGLQVFLAEWRRVTPAERLKLQAVLRNLDRAYEGHDEHLSAKERAHLVKLLEPSRV